MGSKMKIQFPPALRGICIWMQKRCASEERQGDVRGSTPTAYQSWQAVYAPKALAGLLAVPESRPM